MMWTVEDDVKTAVWTSRNITDTTDIFKNDLLLGDLAIDNANAADFFRLQCSNEEVVLPSRELIATVKVQAAGSNARYTVGHGLIHAFFVRLRIGSHWSPIVVHPVSDDRPPVVVAFENVIQLITTTRAMLCAVDRAIAWIDCESLSVAMPIRPDAFDRAGRVDERIVIGRTAIVVEPEDLPFRVGEFLHLIHATTLTDDEVDVALIKNDTRTKVIVLVAIKLFVGLPDPFLIDPSMIFDATTDNGIDRVCLAFLAFGFLPPAIGKAQVDPTILLVVRMDGDLHENALTVLNHLRRAYDRLRVEFAIGGNETQGASMFSHKLAAIWQKGDGPAFSRPSSTTRSIL